MRTSFLVAEIPGTLFYSSPENGVRKLGEVKNFKIQLDYLPSGNVIFYVTLDENSLKEIVSKYKEYENNTSESENTKNVVKHENKPMPKKGLKPIPIQEKLVRTKKDKKQVKVIKVSDHKVHEKLEQNIDNAKLLIDDIVNKVKPAKDVTTLTTHLSEKTFNLLDTYIKSHNLNKSQLMDTMISEFNFRNVLFEPMKIPAPKIRVNFKISKSTYEKLKKYAKMLNLSNSIIIETMIKKYFEKK